MACVFAGNNKTVRNKLMIQFEKSDLVNFITVLSAVKIRYDATCKRMNYSQLRRVRNEFM